ncbi:heme lyase CcmF/NrfE family subunit [Natronospirillum operosum]|uniref:Heme lyase CcmF/NrfE family subunit n=1 Tax=Natronospirillum operosum TaxID=2759953 RepID=A0A4Z0WFH6_9GAMM|nr:heme lyase CcmF/NrfE family subunit [Natronospirillum operosum]TGG95368.1 heme lyase CcmF/NrfE family subunit [Natronospirillum operosum]
MLPEFGFLALIFAFLFSLALGVLPLLGYYRQHAGLMRLARPLGLGAMAFLILSFGVLTWNFLNDDFTVRYVVNHSNSMLPWYYKVSAVWGGHEGSMLLWVMILSFWIVAVAAFSKKLPLDMLAVVMSMMGLVLAAFNAFLIFTSNPFDRVLPFPPADGRDLNPLLQDPGLILHPPMLYMGYVGFSVAFAFAISALLIGRLDSAWARWSRPWTNVAWVFMTLGIALGSWWAYYELGWGGWWFWDPVENASLIPWLLGTALIHSLAATDKRGVYKGWTVLLAISTFSMTLLGTFLVRSGVLNSVHAFANDPSRGFFILLIFAVFTGGSLLLYALRLPALQAGARFQWVSREMFLLGNNLMLTLYTVIIILLTFAPVVNDLLGLRTISIGPPWFNDITTVLAPLLVLLLGVGQWVRWKKHDLKPVMRWSAWALIASVALAVLCNWLYAQHINWRVVLGLSLAWWLALSTLKTLYDSTHKAANPLLGLRKLSRSYYGMILGHVGLLVMIVGVTMATQYEAHQDVRMAPGDRYALGNWTFEFREYDERAVANYETQMAFFNLYRNGRPAGELLAEKRFYPVAGQLMTQAGILGQLNRDLYVSMGEPLTADRETWSVRLHVKPFVRWIWLGSIIMALGAGLAILDKRYRRIKLGET